MDKTGNKVLVVDDDPVVLAAVSTLLERRGYEVVRADGADTAFDMMLKHRLDAVVSDICMPGMTGIELLGKIHELNPGMPVILLTGHSDIDTAIEAMRMGAFDFVMKPFSSKYMASAVEKAVKYRRLLDLERNYKRMLEEAVRSRTSELNEAISMLKEMNRELLLRLVSVAEFRDSGTGAHISRMGLFASRIAEALDMPPEFIEGVMFASQLHDIGKVGIADSILLKPGPLTPEEFESMKAHTTIGLKMLSGSPYPLIQMAATVAATHHERWDGTGYPLGLKGEGIPLEGRIVIICDHYDALMSKRPYKEALSHEEAVRIITEGDERTMPGHFDPRVLEAFKLLEPTFKEIYVSRQD